MQSIWIIQILYHIIFWNYLIINWNFFLLLKIIQPNKWSKHTKKSRTPFILKYIYPILITIQRQYYFLICINIHFLTFRFIALSFNLFPLFSQYLCLIKHLFNCYLILIKHFHKLFLLSITSLINMLQFKLNRILFKPFRTSYF